MQDIVLSIVVLTMNRSEQLIEALESCVSCSIPFKYEFVIINNNSSDNTDEVIKSYIECHPTLQFVYEKRNENLGVGGGRSRGFELANGEYLYFLDDDAVIDGSCKETFFISSVQYLEKNPNVASITTKIYDEMLGYERDVDLSKMKLDGKTCIFKYLGGSHFLRKKAFVSPLYFNVSYGSEEYAPSIKAQDKGYFHVYDPEIRIIHKPKVNKWINGSENMKYIQIRGAAVVYATKVILYPGIFKPILWMGYMRRCKLYLREYPGAKKEADELATNLIAENKHKEEKIRLAVVAKMYKRFGLTVF